MCVQICIPTTICVSIPVPNIHMCVHTCTPTTICVSIPAPPLPCVCVHTCAPTTMCVSIHVPPLPCVCPYLYPHYHVCVHTCTPTTICVSIPVHPLPYVCKIPFHHYQLCVCTDISPPNIDMNIMHEVTGRKRGYQLLYRKYYVFGLLILKNNCNFVTSKIDLHRKK